MKTEYKEIQKKDIVRPKSHKAMTKIFLVEQKKSAE